MRKNTKEENLDVLGSIVASRLCLSTKAVKRWIVANGMWNLKTIIEQHDKNPEKFLASIVKAN